MPVQDWMSSDVVTLDEGASVVEASKLMRENGIQHLPVLKKKRLVGIVSDRDLKEAQPSKVTSLEIHELFYLMDKIKVKNLISPKLFTANRNDTIEKAAATMLKHNISALPVVNNEGKIEGIITKGDVFRAFVSISGINEAELSFGFELEDRPGSIGEVTKVIRAHGGRIVSILTDYERAAKGFRHVYIRAGEVKNEKVLFDELEEKFKVLYRSHDRVD